MKHPGISQQAFSGVSSEFSSYRIRKSIFIRQLFNNQIFGVVNDIYSWIQWDVDFFFCSHLLIEDTLSIQREYIDGHGLLCSDFYWITVLGDFKSVRRCGWLDVCQVAWYSSPFGIQTSGLFFGYTGNSSMSRIEVFCECVRFVSKIKQVVTKLVFIA